MVFIVVVAVKRASNCRAGAGDAGGKGAARDAVRIGDLDDHRPAGAVLDDEVIVLVRLLHVFRERSAELILRRLPRRHAAVCRDRSGSRRLVEVVDRGRDVRGQVDRRGVGVRAGLDRPPLHAALSEHLDAEENQEDRNEDNPRSHAHLRSPFAPLNRLAWVALHLPEQRHACQPARRAAPAHGMSSISW